MVSLALYQPDQAGNVGTILRMGACLNMDVHIIHPCGFSFSRQTLKRSAMDYYDYVNLYEYDDYHDFKLKNTPHKRIVLLTTKASDVYTHCSFEADDILLLGQESAGVPEEVHQDADLRVKIPMQQTMRSMNIAMAGAMIASEALRQTDGFNL